MSYTLRILRNRVSCLTRNHNPKSLTQRKRYMRQDTSSLNDGTALTITVQCPCAGPVRGVRGGGGADGDVSDAGVHGRRDRAEPRGGSGCAGEDRRGDAVFGAPPSGGAHQAGPAGHCHLHLQALVGARCDVRGAGGGGGGTCLQLTVAMGPAARRAPPRALHTSCSGPRAKSSCSVRRSSAGRAATPRACHWIGALLALRTSHLCGLWSLPDPSVDLRQPWMHPFVAL